MATTLKEPHKSLSLSRLIWRAVQDTIALKKEYIIAFLGTIIFVGAQVAEPYIYKIVLDTVETTLKTNLVPWGSIHATIPLVVSGLWGIIFLWVWVSILSILAKYYRNLRFHKKLSVYWGEIISSAMGSFLTKKTHFHLTINNAEKLKIFNRWVDAVYDIAVQVFLGIPKTVLLLMWYVWLGLYIRADLTLCILWVLSIFIVLPIYLGNKAHRLQKTATKLWDKMYSILGDLITNQAVVKLFARESFAVESSRQSVLNAAIGQNNVRYFWGLLDALQSSIQMIIGLVVLLFSVLFYLQGLITIGDIVLFLTIASRISGPYIELEWAYRELVKLAADYSKYREVLDLPPEPDTGTLEYPTDYKNITFQELSFTYPGTERQVLEGVNITLTRGTKTALIGHTWSGKSTLANLLMRFYEPTTGVVSVGDTDIRDITLASYRGQFAAVFQDTTLFNDTLLKNFEFVRDWLTLEQIRTACQDANILEFIDSLPEGFETVVGERGLKLSGGEKQRVAIARAILADPSILILDEATSALDAMTERLVTQALEKLMVGRTSLIIAHRLSTIQGADQICLLDQGKVTASGAHAELYASSPEYKQMVDYQRNGFIE